MSKICAVFLVFVISSYATAEDGENGSSLTGLVEGTSTKSEENGSSLTGLVKGTSTKSEENGSSLTGWVEGTSTKSGEFDKICFGSESDSKSEIVLRDLKDVSVHCQADYPVELDFESHTVRLRYRKEEI